MSIFDLLLLGKPDGSQTDCVCVCRALDGKTSEAWKWMKKNDSDREPTYNIGYNKGIRANNEQSIIPSQILKLFSAKAERGSERANERASRYQVNWGEWTTTICIYV